MEVTSKDVYIPESAKPIATRGSLKNRPNKEKGLKKDHKGHIKDIKKPLKNDTELTKLDFSDVNFSEEEIEKQNQCRFDDKVIIAFQSNY